MKRLFTIGRVQVGCASSARGVAFAWVVGGCVRVRVRVRGNGAAGRVLIVLFGVIILVEDPF